MVEAKEEVSETWSSTVSGETKFFRVVNICVYLCVCVCIFITRSPLSPFPVFLFLFSFLVLCLLHSPTAAPGRGLHLYSGTYYHEQRRRALPASLGRYHFCSGKFSSCPCQRSRHIIDTLRGSCAATKPRAQIL